MAQWREQRVPDYLALTKKWGSIDLNTASGHQLLEGVNALADADTDYWFEGFLRVMLLTRQSDSAFHGFLERNAPGEGFTSGHFLTGLKSVTMETEEELWAIAKLIRAEGLHDLVVTTPASRLLDALQDQPSGGPVLESIGHYLDKYGHQIQSLDFCEPTAGEDPTLVLLNLKALVQDPDYDPDARQAELTVKREEALKRANEYFTGTVDVPVRSRVPDRQPEKRDANEEFHRLLTEAKRYYPLREEGLFYLGAGWPALRRLALELGRRLVEVGTLASVDRVFYLTNTELQEALKAQSEARALPEYGQRAADRFDLREARKRLRNPPQIPLPDIESGKAEGQGMGGVRITGGWVLGSVQMQNAPASGTLEGFACSPGQVTTVAGRLRQDEAGHRPRLPDDDTGLDPPV
jgi:pyruvate,water dikinase